MIYVLYYSNEIFKGPQLSTLLMSNRVSPYKQLTVIHCKSIFMIMIVIENYNIGQPQEVINCTSKNTSGSAGTMVYVLGQFFFSILFVLL